MKPMLGAAAMLAALSVPVAGCSTDALEDPGDRAKSATKLRLSITTPRSDRSTRAESIRVQGRVTRGSSVRVDGDRATVSGTRFRSRASLDLGRNRIRVVARKDGYDTRRRTLTITREREPLPEPVATPVPTPDPTPEPAPEQACDPNYEGACLDPNSSDYDCEGGSGDGPDYTGTVQVVGADPHDLDRDGDGIACDQ